MKDENTASTLVTPVQIKREDIDGISIQWSDGFLQHLSSEVLRAECPCAECKELRGDPSHAKPLSPKPSLLQVIDHAAEESLQLEAIWAVGNYGLGVRWGDGHSTGIYTFSYLRTL